MTKIDYSIYYRQFHDETEQHSESVINWLINIIKPHLNLPKNAKILDIGCGFGFALKALQKLGYNNISGIEISQEQAIIAQNSGFEVIVTESTIDLLNNNPSTYDFVILFDVLEHQPVDIQIDFLRAIYTTLRPGGKLLLSVPNANAILHGRWRYNDYTHYSSFTEHSLYFVLRNAGFENIWIDSNKGIGRFPRRLWRKSAWPIVRKWIVRWCWLQIYKAEIPAAEVEKISFELNLTASAIKNG